MQEEKPYKYQNYVMSLKKPCKRHTQNFFKSLKVAAKKIKLEDKAKDAKTKIG